MIELAGGLIFLAFFFAIWAIFGHLMWLAVAFLLRKIFDKPRRSVSTQSGGLCSKCSSPTPDPLRTRIVPSVEESSLLDDLATTERQIVRLYEKGKLGRDAFLSVLNVIELERIAKVKRPAVAEVPEFGPANLAPSIFETNQLESSSKDDKPSSIPISAVTETVPMEAASVSPTFLPSAEPETVPQTANFEPSPPRTRKPFSEVLNAFMEESNIRWGELIGGLLIIGCSTALTVSLWSEISRIPVLKFLIFTTVTAVLFGVGLYTEHRWKLPTTSRGILTIATLLVPLNFLAIAAVSSTSANGGLVIASELVAPAIFLCLVYSAGRTITPGHAHLLAAGILGSSVGQLLVRHFASTESSASLLLFLGAFPVACYAVSVGLVLRGVLADHKIDEQETGSLFTVLGTMSFAALLPFGLLLYRSGPVSMTMMYLAPLITVWGLPLLATGTLIWRRISDREMIASRTTGTALGILGAMIVLAGMILAWPNPASIVPTALLNFAIFTTLAIVLELPIAHAFAALCFSLAYLVTFQVFAGNINWENLRVVSLLRVSLSVSSGESLVGIFLACLVSSELLAKAKRIREGNYYLASACAIAVISLVLVLSFSTEFNGQHGLWAILAVYSLGSIWIAWRRELTSFAWIGSALLLPALVESLKLFDVSFPWQTGIFVHATICAVAAVVCSHHRSGSVLKDPLNASALISSFFAIICLLQGNPWQVTSSQSARVFWLAGILLTSLWLNRTRIIFTAFQITLTSAFIFTVKGFLQQFDWYSYLPHAFMHPWGLQIQLTVLVMLSLAWVSVRLAVRKSLVAVPLTTAQTAEPSDRKSWITDLWKLLDTNLSVDQLVSWIAVPSLLLLALYGSASGLARQLTSRSVDYPGWDIAGFPHWEALGLGSWIVLGLLTLTMIGSWWERRHKAFLLGAVATLAAALPLIAGRFEFQIATATAWCWLAAFFFAAGSFLVWKRDNFSKLINAARASERAVGQLITLLLAISVTPILVLTIYPALRAIVSLPLHRPESGMFSLLNDDVLYGVPLLVIALALIGHALRERRAGYAMAAGLFLNLTVSVVYLLSIVAAGMDRVVLIRVLQLNAITFAIYGALWLAKQKEWSENLTSAETESARFWLNTQQLLSLLLNVVLIIPSLVLIVYRPDRVSDGTFALGSTTGWLALASSMGLSTWINRREKMNLSARKLVVRLLIMVCLFAFTAAEFNVALWTGLHALIAGCLLTSLVLLLLSELPKTVERNDSLPGLLSSARDMFSLDQNWLTDCRSAFVIIASFAVFLALRIFPREPSNHWWPIGALFATSAMFALLNGQAFKRRYLYIAGILFNLAASIFWLRFLFPRFSSFASFVEMNVIAATLSSLPFLYLELRARRMNGEEAGHAPDLSYHTVAGVGAIVILAMIVGSGSGLGPYVSPNLIWMALVSTILLSVANLWDVRCKHAVAGLYLLGLLAVAICLQRLALTVPEALFFGVVLLSSYAIATSLVYRYQDMLIALCLQLKIPLRVFEDRHAPSWLSALNVVVVSLVIALALWLNIKSIKWAFRAGSAVAVISHLFTFIFMAPGRRQKAWHKAAFAVSLIGITFLVWSGLSAAAPGTWLNRSVITSVIFLVVINAYSFFFSREEQPTSNVLAAVKESLPWVVAVGLLSLMFSFGIEIFYQTNFGAVMVPMITAGTIGFTLIAIMVTCIAFALWPERDPLGVSESGRAGYVYFAELMLALLFVHIRLTLPWLFTGFFTLYWPLIVMAVAYFGVVVSEALRRQELPVLSKPIERSGAFLPLLPVLGFWLAHSEVNYSLLLLVVGGLYGLLSILRRSFVWGALAAVAGNGGLWYWLQQTNDFHFFQHPQLWLIPVAASVLIAAHLNEEKLSDDQMAGLSYLSLVTIYVSSTADIFVNGVANSPWLPLVLGALSLCGVFSGILLKVRGLLLLGSVFLLLSITTMIWYASANLGWTWLWYVAGIATGASIIFMFAIFEKKRNEVLRVVDGLREWDR